MKDYAVVGSGIGGSSIAAYLDFKGYDTVLFEKESNLGGCSSSFTHKGFTYNTGATTLAGYENGFIVKELFDSLGFTPYVIETDPSIVVIQNGKVTPRYRDLDLFLASLQKNYPHVKNVKFWTLIHLLNKKFYKVRGYYYANSSMPSKILSLISFLPLALKFQKYLRGNAEDFISNFFGNISQEYKQFLESQILIVAQAPLKEINFLTAALCLGYTFNHNHYVMGGFSKLFDGLTANMKDVRRNNKILSIIRLYDHFELHTKSNVIKAKKLILNSTVYDSQKLFEFPNAKNYYKKYEKLDNHQSSFMLYMTVKSSMVFHHHYQIIKNKTFAHTISKALFISLSHKDDTIIAPKDHYSITASIHTDTRFWDNESTYKSKKEELKDLLVSEILDILQLKNSDVVHCFTATPKTFNRYIKRSQLGGNAMTMKNFLPFLPGNDSPIKNLYNVGDTVYAAQGWTGVMFGVKNLQKLLHV